MSELGDLIGSPASARTSKLSHGSTSFILTLLPSPNLSFGDSCHSLPITDAAALFGRDSSLSKRMLDNLGVSWNAVSADSDDDDDTVDGRVESVISLDNAENGRVVCVSPDASGDTGDEGDDNDVSAGDSTFVRTALAISRGMCPVSRQ